MTVGIQGKKKNGLHVPLAIISTTMCASEVDVNAVNMTTSHGTWGDNVASP